MYCSTRYKDKSFFFAFNELMFTKIYKEKYTLHYLRVAKLIVAGNAFKCRLY